MTNEYSISIYLDSRRAKANGKFPVKLRVYTSKPRKQKLYPTVFEYTEKEFNAIWHTSKPRQEHKPSRKKMQAIEVKATKVAENLNPFTFEQFEKRLYRNEGDGTNIKYQYNSIIKEFQQEQKIGTASIYDLSQKAIKDFAENNLNWKYDKLTLFDITPRFLQDYETYMTVKKGRSLTTVSMYLRALKAIFNKAIDENEIEKEFYPFGKRKYQVHNLFNYRDQKISNIQTIFCTTYKESLRPCSEFTS